jgi:hypothetical protein
MTAALRTVSRDESAEEAAESVRPVFVVTSVVGGQTAGPHHADAGRRHGVTLPLIVELSAATFDEDDVAPPIAHGEMPADPFADADDAEIGRLVQGEAGVVLREDTGLQGPAAEVIGAGRPITTSAADGKHVTQRRLIR